MDKNRGSSAVGYSLAPAGGAKLASGNTPPRRIRDYFLFPPTPTPK